MTPIRPADGQESVWDYPRPPRIERVDARVRIRLGGTVIVDTRDVVRVLETSHPPVYYLPIADFSPGSVDSGRWVVVLRVQGLGPVLLARVGRDHRRARGLELPESRAGIRVAARPRGRLRRPGRRRQRRRRDGRARSPEASTEAGSPRPSSGPSRASRARSAGEKRRTPGAGLPGFFGVGGPKEIRTPDLLDANEARYQLRHRP